MHRIANYFIISLHSSLNSIYVYMTREVLPKRFLVLPDYVLALLLVGIWLQFVDLYSLNIHNNPAQIKLQNSNLKFSNIKCTKPVG